MYTLIAFLLLLLVTYPQSPVLFLFFNEYNAELYVLYATVLFLLIAQFNPRLRTGKHTYIGFFFIYLIIYAVSIVKTKNITAIRDIMTVALVLTMVIGLHKEQFISIFRKYVLLNAGFLLISIVVTFICLLVGFDGWGVAELTLISENSPVYIRNEWADFHYFMPFYLTLITIADQAQEIAFGFTFERMPFLYIEPSSVWSYTLGLLFYTLGDRKIPCRSTIILIFITALLFSCSVYGLIVLIAMCLLYVYSLSRFLRSNYIISISLLLAAIVLVAYKPSIMEAVLSVIGDNKLAQYQHYYDIIDLKGSLTLFGIDASELADKTEHKSYGVLGVFIRYGIFGMFFYVCIWLTILFKALSLCFSQLYYSKTMMYYSMACISSLLVQLKSPQMNLLLPILLLAALEIMKTPHFNKTKSRIILMKNPTVYIG